MPVFPTRVGMVRAPPGPAEVAQGFPHARGDGPIENTHDTLWRRFSPRAWGWSGVPLPGMAPVAVFPTRVGMVRQTDTAIFCRYRFPHARGDGPSAPARTRFLETFSPRAWGWSGNQCQRPGVLQVFPTRVGMVRGEPGSVCDFERFPHARGDGPPG